MTEPLPDSAPERAAVIPIGRGEVLPAPLVAPTVDLRGYSSFMLDVDRLLTSELVALATPEEGWAAVLLWCRAWKQEPPGSLPDDDRVLASFSGAGKRWPKIRAMALRGFVKCSDGRLYHRVLCGEVDVAWKRRQEHDRKRERDADRLRAWRERNAIETPNETRFDAATSQRDRTGQDNTGQDRTELQSQKITSTSGATLPPASPPAGPAKPRATRLPPDWALPDDWRDWAVRAYHLDPQRVVRISLTFRDYWHSKPKDATKLDWLATWRNWIRKECGDGA